MESQKKYIAHMEAFSCELSLCSPEEALVFPETESLLWLSDTRIWAALQSPSAPKALREALASLPKDRLLLLEPGEEHKEWAQVEKIILKGFELGLARDSRIVALGGGVICDMAAFAASIYLRGCKLSLIPTSLLSMVDAAFGGKTGINFSGYKNMVGSFYPAQEVRIVPDLCASLPDSEYLCGLAELIKAALLDDASLWQRLKNQKTAILARDPAILAELIWDALMVKVRFVEADLREQSIRAYLNLGHTFAHGLESVSGLGTWSHGAAVAWGIVKALQLSERLGYCSQDWQKEVREFMETYGYRTQVEGLDPQLLLKAMTMDKKKKGGRVRFVLQEALGKNLSSPVDDADVLAVLNLP